MTEIEKFIDWLDCGGYYISIYGYMLSKSDLESLLKDYNEYRKNML